jgi:hypothetical protein
VVSCLMLQYIKLSVTVVSQLSLVGSSWLGKKWHVMATVKPLLQLFVLLLVLVGVSSQGILIHVPWYS